MKLLQKIFFIIAILFLVSVIVENYQDYKPKKDRYFVIFMQRFTGNSSVVSGCTHWQYRLTCDSFPNTDSIIINQINKHEHLTNVVQAQSVHITGIYEFKNYSEYNKYCDNKYF